MGRGFGIRFFGIRVRPCFSWVEWGVDGGEELSVVDVVGFSASAYGLAHFGALN